MTLEPQTSPGQITDHRQRQKPFPKRESPSASLPKGQEYNVVGAPVQTPNVISYQLPLTYSLTIQGNAHMDLILLRS